VEAALLEVLCMRKLCCLLTLSGVLTSLGQTAEAAEVTRVASSPWVDEDNRFDLHFGVAYNYNFKRAAVLREWNRGSATDTESRLVKDLMYQQQRHIITPSMELGVWRRLSVYLNVPVVLHDSRSYSFDQRADDCVFGDGVPPATNATCVNRDNSTTIRDEIIPRNGFDATSPAAPFTQFGGAGTELIFQGPVRRGVDQVHVGIKYGILSQAERSHMPDWVVGLEGRFAAGRAMTFSRDIRVSEPAGNSRVGRRVHDLGAWTALSRRYRFLDPYFTAYWYQGMRARGSKFQDFSSFGAQDRVGPQSSAGISFGTEIVPWERKEKGLKVAIDIEGLAMLRYGGRGYSEIWELLADSPAMVGSFDPTTQRLDAGGNPIDGAFCDREAAMDFARQNPGDSGYVAAGGGSCQKFEGITDLQDFGTFGFRGGINLHLGPYARLMAGASLQTDTRHFVTFANRGDASAGGGGGDSDRVEPGTVQVNPVRRDVVDNVGRRYMVDDVIDVYGYLRFMLTF
jgi:hypothetical protein